MSTICPMSEPINWAYNVPANAPLMPCHATSTRGEISCNTPFYLGFPLLRTTQSHSFPQLVEHCVGFQYRPRSCFFRQPNNVHPWKRFCFSIHKAKHIQRHQWDSCAACNFRIASSVIGTTQLLQRSCDLLGFFSHTGSTTRVQTRDRVTSHIVPNMFPTLRARVPFLGFCFMVTLSAFVCNHPNLHAFHLQLLLLTFHFTAALPLVVSFFCLLSHGCHSIYKMTSHFIVKASWMNDIVVEITPSFVSSPFTLDEDFSSQGSKHRVCEFPVRNQ